MSVIHAFKKCEIKRNILAIVAIIAIVAFLLVVLYSKTESSECYKFLDDGVFRVSAHRGGTLFAPENTIEAVAAAIDAGYGAVEVDPRKSSDGIIYLMHDDDVLRTTGKDGSIEEMTSHQISELTIIINENSVYSGIAIPTFEDIVKLLVDKNVVLNVDCSKGNWNDGGYVDEVVRILKKYNMLHSSFFVVSDAQIREKMFERYPELCFSWLYDPAKQTIDEYILDAKYSTYTHFLLSVKDEYADYATIEKLIDSGMYFQIYNVNDENRFELLKSYGVPMIETDDLLP